MGIQVAVILILALIERNFKGAGTVLKMEHHLTQNMAKKLLLKFLENTMKKSLALLILIIFALGFGCKHEQNEQEQKENESPLTTDWCNDDTYANVDFVSYSSGSFCL